MGWLALHFPHLPVEILDRGEEAPAPLAIWVTRSGARRILFVNPAARALGVAPGQSAAAALALAADLRLVARRPRNEQLALEGIARWALGFSPELSLAPPAALVLGIQRSLALFGGEQALLKGLLDGVAALGYQAHWGLAPTPAAALLLARQGGVAPVRELAALPAILDGSPCGTWIWHRKPWNGYGAWGRGLLLTCCACLGADWRGASALSYCCC